MLFFFILFISIFTISYIANNATIIREAKSTISSEPWKNKQIINIIEHEIKLPMDIGMKLSQGESLVNPAIILPDQTPVIGNGMATNPPSNISFLIVDDWEDNLFNLELYFSWTNPVKKRFFILRVKKIIGNDGIILPTKPHINAQYHGRTFSPSKEELSANGIAIRPSSAGIIAIIITASQMLFAKKSAKFSKMWHLLF